MIAEEELDDFLIEIPWKGRKKTIRKVSGRTYVRFSPQKFWSK